MISKSCIPLCFYSHALISPATSRAPVAGWRSCVQSTDVSVSIPMELVLHSSPADLGGPDWVPSRPLGDAVSAFACARVGNIWDRSNKELLNKSILLSQRVKILLKLDLLFIFIRLTINTFRDRISNKLFSPYCEKKKILKTAGINNFEILKKKVHEKQNEFTKNWCTCKIFFSKSVTIYKNK